MWEVPGSIPGFSGRLSFYFHSFLCELLWQAIEYLCCKYFSRQLVDKLMDVVDLWKGVFSKLMVFDFSLISLRIALQAIQYLGKYFWMQLGVGELAQVVERSLSMWEVPGSIPDSPFSSSIFHALWKLRFDWYNQVCWYCRELAQVVEHSLCMWEVPGLIPGFSSRLSFYFHSFLCELLCRQLNICAASIFPGSWWISWWML